MAPTAAPRAEPAAASNSSLSLWRRRLRDLACLPDAHATVLPPQRLAAVGRAPLNRSLPSLLPRGVRDVLGNADMSVLHAMLSDEQERRKMERRELDRREPGAEPRTELRTELTKPEQHAALLRLLREGPLLRHPSRQAPQLAAALRGARRAGVRANASAAELQREGEELRCVDALLLGTKKRKGLPSAKGLPSVE